MFFVLQKLKGDIESKQPDFDQAVKKILAVQLESDSVTQNLRSRLEAAIKTTNVRLTTLKALAFQNQNYKFCPFVG